MLDFRGNLTARYPDILTATALSALDELAPLDARRKDLMTARIARRRERARQRQPIEFLNPDRKIAGTAITVAEARAGRFTGGEIPPDLQRQWIQGTGPAARPNTPIAQSI